MFRLSAQEIRDSLTLRWQTALLVAAVCAGAVGLSAAGAALIARGSAVAAADRELETLATTMADRLDHHMFERYREIKNIASFPTLQQIWERDPADIRRTLELVQSSLPEYAWLGFATPDGNVRSATKGMLEGVSVAARPWFINGLKGATVEDVHDAKLLDKLLRSSPEQEPFRFVDVAIPVRLPDGKLAGVLGAHMSWSWAEDVRRTVLSAEQAEAGADVLVLSRSGEVLLGPKDQTLSENNPGDAGGVRIFTQQTPNGGMRTAVVATQGYQDYPGLGWRIAARKPVAVIYVPASRLVWQILALGGLAVLAATVVAWFVAGTVARPLQKLSEQLDPIGRRSGATSVERQHGSKDVLHLSATIRSLLRRVGAAEAEQQSSSSTIAALKLELENQVKASEEKTMRFGADLHALRILADTDSMTGLLNRRAFLPYAEDALSYYKRYQRQFSILMFDIDHFKRINDTYGHSAGDDVIRAVADLISQEIRNTDKFARFGGEEFVLLLRETDAVIAADLAERLREKVADLRVPTGGRDITLTVSVGCAVADETGRDVEDFIQRADEALYAAKAAGRNRVRSFREDRLQDRSAA